MNIPQTITNPETRHDFLLLFDVQDGNPNGDPDAGNMPRIDPETMQGLVTDVCLKRKVRNYVDANAGDSERLKIYVQDKGIALNTLHARAYTAKDLKSSGTKQKREDVSAARAWMCENFYDIRMFGAVMTTEVNCGQVRGPVQLTFARSIDPIVPLDVSITRVAITRESDVAVVEGDDGKTEGGKRTEMGRKAVLPYGLYLGRGFFSPKFAADTGVTVEDLKLFWQALVGMFDLDRSASRGFMSMRGLYVFTHQNALGNAPVHELFEKLRVSLKTPETPPRAFSDYAVALDETKPEGVDITRVVG